MAHSRNGRFPRRAGASRRRVSWSLGPRGILSAGDSAISLFSVSAESLLDDLTIVRTRGRLTMFLSGVGTANDGQRWAFGMCVVTQNAAGIGATAVPDPIADIGWDGWFVYETGTLVSGDTTPLTDPGQIAQAVIEIDSKAMRKLHLTDTVVGILGNAEIGASSTMVAALDTRMLSKLP